jgi:DMSO reductase anchor subunit
VAFAAFAALATLYSVVVFMMRPIALAGPAEVVIELWVRWLGWSVALAGVIAVFCSTMIYVFTQRECWTFVRVGARFALTCAILGVAAIWLSILASTLWAPSSPLFTLAHECGPTLCRTLVMMVAAKLAFELAAFRHLSYRKMTTLKRSALLMTGDLSNATLARFALGALGGVILPLLLVGEAATLSGGSGLVQFVALTTLLFAACLSGEMLERYLFFAACVSPQMPGGIR